MMVMSGRCCSPRDPPVMMPNLPCRLRILLYVYYVPERWAEMLLIGMKNEPLLLLRNKDNLTNGRLT